MTVEEIVHGESKNVEFKVTLPKDSEKYTKTVVAFANTQGGKLIFGVDDKTRKVAGIDEDELFRMMDRISNAISDSCNPQIVPNIEPQTVDGKTIIVVTVTPGANRPYYLKSRGKDAGTFIRVAGTSRPAYPEKIKELEMEGARIYWDELTCVGYEVTEDAVEKLCCDIIKFRNEMGLPKRDVTITQLMNWKLLKRENDSLLASNAFVLRNIRLGSTIDGLVRKESYELPLEAIREMIINAHCHRNLTDDSCVQVAIYDDRLEVTSPGGLYNGLTFEELMNGHSKIRNRAIASIFNKMGLVESWGTGVKRILGAAKSYGLPAPRFQVFDDMFRVDLFRSAFPIEEPASIGEASEKHGRNIGEASEKHGRSIGEASEKHSNIFRDDLNDTQKRILELLSQDAQLSAKKIADAIGISSRNIESNIKKLKKCGILIRHGSPKNGYWEIY